MAVGPKIVQQKRVKSHVEKERGKLGMVEWRIINGNFGGRKDVNQGASRCFSGHEDLAKRLMRPFGLTIGLRVICGRG